MYKTGCRILMINGILFIVIGLYSVLFNNTSLFSIINWIMDPNFWGNEKLSNGTLNFKIFTWDFLGMFHIIWGINIFYIVRYNLMEKKEAWAWRCLVIQVIVWLFVVVYFTMSIKHNSFFPVTIFFAVLFIIPLLMTIEVLKKRDSGNNNVQSKNKL
jgi:hypothetical protein